MANHFLRRQANWEELYFYKKTDVLCQLTFAFAKRFLKMGDRTIDQMVQAARSEKQNIAEGCADGVSSTEMEIKLINVARASIKELKEDYEDYLTTRNLCKWDDQHPRFAPPCWTSAASTTTRQTIAQCITKPRTRNWPIWRLPSADRWTR